MVVAIQTDIDEASRLETETVLADIGVTLPEAVAMLMRHIIAEKSLPFPTSSDCPYCPAIPSPAMLEAIAEAERGGLPTFNSVAELMADLYADD